MIVITKEQAEYLRDALRGVRIVRTCQGNSRRGKHYVENSAAVRSALVKYTKESGEKIIYDSARA